MTTDEPAAQGQSLAEQLSRVVDGRHHSPHDVLGPHIGPDGVTVRALRPWARAVSVVVGDLKVPLNHVADGVWTGVLPMSAVPDYRLEVDYGDGPALTDDPYRFLPTLGPLDLHLISEGRHEQLWSVLGAHVREYPSTPEPVRGTSFAVWAPNAHGVRVVGDFNFWDGRGFPMRSLGSSGVWELFVPGPGTGNRYKFEVLGSDGVRRLKADPMARAAERPPATASVVTESQYRWQDADWMNERASRDPHTGPLSAYEVHLGSWRKGLSYDDLSVQLVDYVRENGFTHVEFMPVAEHPFGGSWGYQVTSYYAPTARFGSPDNFRHLVDSLHRAGIGVILDWVPAHFPKDAFSLVRFDGTPLYEHGDPRRGEHPEWGTLIFDFGRREVRNFLVANAVYWLQEFHVDGLRVDAVASMLYLDYARRDGEWTPNRLGGRENLEAVSFLQEANATVYKRAPGAMMIAEESTAWPGVTRTTDSGGLGFGLKWNMGWMHDTLGYIGQDPVHRAYHHNQMTFPLMYAWSERYLLPLSHDEMVHGKGSLLRKIPGDRWRQLATLRAYFAYMWAHPGKQLLFMGGEFAQESEWSEGRSLDWWLLDNPDHRGVLDVVRDMNLIYRRTPSLWQRDHEPGGFEWIDADNAPDNVFSFLRWGFDRSAEPVIACVANFAAVPHYGFRLALPFAGRWHEVLNTDADQYAGSGVGNLGGVSADSGPHRGFPASATLVLPPLSTLWLRHDP